jgi:hypothetical protein
MMGCFSSGDAKSASSFATAMQELIGYAFIRPER